MKPRLYKFVGFFQRKRSFLGWIMKLSRLFPAIQQMFFEFWKQIGEIEILSVQINFFRRKIFWKKTQFDIFLQNLVGIFKKFCKKKELSTEICQQSYQDGTLRLPRDFSFFCLFLVCLQKASLCPNELFEEIFLWTNNCLRFFSVIEQNIVIIRQQHFNRLSKFRSICLDCFFHGNFFTWKLKNSWITFYGNWAVCLRKNWLKKSNSC